MGATPCMGTKAATTDAEEMVTTCCLDIGATTGYMVTQVRTELTAKPATISSMVETMMTLYMAVEVMTACEVVVATT